MGNPFTVGALAAGRHFVGREAEVQCIGRAFRQAGGRLLVYGDRRLGVSSAVARSADAARGVGVPVAVASLGTATDPAEAAQRLLAAVQREYGPGWRELIEPVALDLGLSMEVGPATPDAGGLPALKFGFGTRAEHQPHRLLPAVLGALDARLADRGRVLGLALDEFQRVLEWGGEAAGWALRESLAAHRALGCVLAGHSRSAIEARLRDEGGAFWDFGDSLAIGPIAAHQLADWITDQGARTGVTISHDASRLIVRLTWPRTRDVVQLARAVWFDGRTRGATDPGLLVRQAFERTVREQGVHYDGLWGRLDNRERAVLRAFAADPGLQITAAETMRRFQLGPKSSVFSTVERLVAAEHLSRLGPGRYEFDDPYFRRYVQVCGLPDIGETPPPLWSNWPGAAGRDRLAPQATGVPAATPARRYSSTSAAL